MLLRKTLIQTKNILIYNNTWNGSPNNIEIDKKSYEAIFISYIAYETPDRAKSFHIIFNQISGYIDDNNGTYLTLFYCWWQ